MTIGHGSTVAVVAVVGAAYHRLRGGRGSDECNREPGHDSADPCEPKNQIPSPSTDTGDPKKPLRTSTRSGTTTARSERMSWSGLNWTIEYPRVLGDNRSVQTPDRELREPEKRVLVCEEV
jgi:hypothetical protein